ncbi:MAG: HD-GYP domain-containing protein, partial [Actinomycetota bacterium]
SQAIDAKDAHAHGHSDKVVAIAIAIAEQMHLDKDVIKGIREAGYLHDIGKLGASESIFGKAGPLTEEEMMTVREHPGLSHQLLEGAQISPEIMEMIRHHHERFDGNGYPDELKGGEIPLGARILCVADAFEAMTSERSYRPPISKEEAVNELKRWSGTQFDPKVVEAFIEVKE